MSESRVIFLSRSSADLAFARPLIAALKNDPYRYEVREQGADLKTGDDFVRFMDDALRGAQATVALLSTPYLKSEWCRREARSADAQKNHRLIPFLIEEGCSPDGLLASLIYLDVAGQRSNVIARLIHEVIETGKPIAEAPPARDYLRRTFITNARFDDERVFVGRDGALVALEQGLWREGGVAAIVPVHGQGGVGKTALAEAYARANRHRYRGVWQVRAETRETLVQDLAALAARLDDRWAGAHDLEMAAKAGLDLVAQLGGRPFLIAYDNAPNPGAVGEFRPRAGAHVLVTSRWSDWPGVSSVALDVLTPEAGAALLRELAGRGTEAETRMLSELLGHLPLALTHAGAVLRRSKLVTFTEYALNLQARIEAAPRVADYDRSVRAALESNLAQVVANDEDAPTLLAIAAFLAPDAIPLELWDTEAALASLPLRMRDPVARAEAFGVLSVWSVITIDASNKTISLHRLTQAVVRALLAESGMREQRARTAGAAVDALFPGGHGDEDDSSDPRIWPRCARLASHVPVLLTHEAAPARLLSNTGLFYASRADYAISETLCRQALALDEATHGPNHPDTARSLSNLGTLLFETKRHLESETLSRRALDIDQAHFGPDHSTVAIRLNNLGIALVHLNRFAAAEPLLRRALEIATKRFASDHPFIALYLGNLGLLLTEAGRWAEAEPIQRRALAIDEAKLGPDHPYVGLHLGNLAGSLMMAGRLTDAEAFAARAIRIAETSLPDRHPWLAEFRLRLAEVQRAQRDASLVAAQVLSNGSQSASGVALQGSERLGAFAGALRFLFGKRPPRG